jgi:uncharacterized protein YndB with AHSA1/START domain
MANVKKTITIAAPAEKVFGYISEPTNLPEFWPSLVEVTDVRRLANGGTSNRWVYKMGGIRLEGTSDDQEYVANQRLVSKTTGGADSIQTWMLEPDADGTKVTFEIQYTVPMPVLGRLAEAVIVKMNEREGDLILANLKSRMEA